MTWLWYYSVDASTVLEITDRVRLPLLDAEPASVGSHAEEGSGASAQIEVDDPDLDLIMLIGRRIYSTNDGAPAGGQVVGNWFIQNLDVQALEAGSQKGRKWIVQMVDENSLLSRRIFVGATSDRGEETDIARILWMLGETEVNTLSPDLTYIDQTGPITLDAADYTLQNPKAVMEHCKKASGKNYWIKYEEADATGGAIVSSSVANPTVITTTTAHGLVTGQQVVIAGHSGSTPTINGTRTVTVTGATTFTIPVNVTVGGTGGTTTTVGRYVLAYYDAATWDGYPSTLSLSNVASEINSTTVFAISEDTRLNRSGDRAPVSGVVEPYVGGYVYEQDTDVGDTYVYRDVAAPSVNVKTEAKATAIAVRELAELATPDDEVETEIVVQQAQINLAMHGMSINLHATHLPPYTDETEFPAYATGQAMRIMRRQVRQIGPTTFGNRMWLTPMGTGGQYMLGFIVQRSGFTAYGSGIVPWGRAVACGSGDFIDPWTHLATGFADNGTGSGTDFPGDVAYLAIGPSHSCWAWGAASSLNGTSRPTAGDMIITGATGPPVLVGRRPTTLAGHTVFDAAPTSAPSLPAAIVAPDAGLMFALLWGWKAGDPTQTLYTVTSPASGVVTLADVDASANPALDAFHPRTWLGYKAVTASESVTWGWTGSHKDDWQCMVVFVPGADAVVSEFVLSGTLGGNVEWGFA